MAPWQTLILSFPILPLASPTSSLFPPTLSFPLSLSSPLSPFFFLLQCPLYPVPSEPRDVTITNLTSTSFTVTWLPPANPNGIIDNYTLQYTDTTMGMVVVEIGITTESQVLEGLSPARGYRVVVSALTDKGPGPESVPLVVTTLEDGKT